MEHLPPADTPPSYLAVPHDMESDLYRLLPESDNSEIDIERICPFQQGEWFMEPSYHGATPMLFDNKTGNLFTRGMSKISSLLYFDEIRDKLERIPKSDDVRWFHLIRINGLDDNAAKHSCVLIDFMSQEQNYSERREFLEKVGPPQVGIRERPIVGCLHLVPRFSEEFVEEMWGGLHLMNQQWGAPLYDGIILKKSTALYPLNNSSVNHQTHIWHEHRFVSPV